MHVASSHVAYLSLVLITFSIVSITMVFIHYPLVTSCVCYLHTLHMNPLCSFCPHCRLLSLLGPLDKFVGSFTLGPAAPPPRMRTLAPLLSAGLIPHSLPPALRAVLPLPAWALTEEVFTDGFTFASARASSYTPGPALPHRPGCPCAAQLGLHCKATPAKHSPRDL